MPVGINKKKDFNPEFKAKKNILEARMFFLYMKNSFIEFLV